MKKLTVLVATALLCGAVFAVEPPLAERHLVKGTGCRICHGTDKPEPFAEVDNTVCLGCHGPKSQLERKFTVKYGNKNPHKNHLGDVSCGICHKGHSSSSVYCENCHKDFKLTIR